MRGQTTRGLVWDVVGLGVVVITLAALAALAFTLAAVDLAARTVGR